MVISMLSAIQVRNAKPKAKPYKITDGKGLFLHIAVSGKKTWRYRYELAGTESTFVIGEYPMVTLEAARAERMSLRELVRAGINPADQRRRERLDQIKAKEAEKLSRENTFEAIAREWHHLQRDRWTKEHSNSVIATLKHDVFPIIGDMPVDQVDPPRILEVIRAIEKRGAIEIAKKTLQRLSAVFRYAVQTGRATFNPASDMKGVLKSRKVKHHSMIKPEELPDFLDALRVSDIHTTTKLAIQFTILTASRSGEVRGATWDEIEIEKQLWSIPAKRMKMKSPHTIPLSSYAMAIINRLKILYGDSGLIFPGIHYPEKPLSENTMLYALYRIGYHSKATMHGFRALFSTICNESGFNPDAIERQLAHRESNSVRAAYHRSEYLPERIEMMEWWAKYLMSAGL
jgi:integrase